MRAIAVQAALLTTTAASAALRESKYTCCCFAVTRCATPLAGTPNVDRQTIPRWYPVPSQLSCAGVGSGWIRVGCRRGCDMHDGDARRFRAVPESRCRRAQTIASSWTRSPNEQREGRLETHMTHSRHIGRHYQLSRMVKSEARDAAEPCARTENSIHSRSLISCLLTSSATRQAGDSSSSKFNKCLPPTGRQTQVQRTGNFAAYGTLCEAQTASAHLRDAPSLRRRSSSWIARAVLPDFGARALATGSRNYMVRR